MISKLLVELNVSSVNEPNICKAELKDRVFS